ncbi:hypothetical protein B0H17DRAFT_1143624 [Mycena rosella]|uniref:Uncharacterized protein n=1 Tax=Mycena rosella TaxID=1033263 RepID=A0AAD7CUN3_MYCRO|nr:hypothetical protein B0H17DRAFT_1143624 [Mycena rosella]
MLCNRLASWAPLWCLSSPLDTMSIFPLLNLVLYCLFVCATRNITIDDASPLVTYDAPVLQRNITAFDSRLLEDGTITFVAPTPNASPTISISFTGIAIYIFVAYPGYNESAPSGFTAFIDGAEAGGWAAAESALLYRHLVYHSAVLADAPHTLVMQIKPNWELYFDYALYTSTVSDPALSATSGGASAQQITGGTASSSATPITTGTKKPLLGVAIGAALGGAVFVALGCGGWILLRPRRAAKKRTLTPFTDGFRIDDDSEKDGAPPPATPFLLRSPPSARRKSKSKSALLDGGVPPTGTVDAHPNPSDPEPAALVGLTTELRRLTASVQRLETGIPEARDGGPVLQRPPAYMHGV